MCRRFRGRILLVAAMVIAAAGGLIWLGGDAPAGDGKRRSGPIVSGSPAGKHWDRGRVVDRREQLLVAWRRLQEQLEPVYPGAVRHLAPGTGAEESEILAVEQALGRKLPGELREFLKLWRGDVVDPGEVFQDRWEPFYEGCDLIELRRMAEITAMMNDVADDEMTDAEARVFTQREPRVGDFWHPRLVQITNSHGGSELGIDCHTGEIWSYCGANYQLEGIVAPSWKGLLDAMSASLEDERFELDQLLYFRLPLWDETGEMVEQRGGSAGR